MPEHSIRQLENEDPERARSFLGELPDLGPSEQMDFEFFWLVRPRQPADHPLDLEACLRLYRELYGSCKTHRLIERILIMDHEYMTTVREETPPSGR